MTPTWHNLLLQVSKPYTSFFTDENLGSMKLIVQPSDGETGRQHDDVDNLHGNLGDANYEQADEHEYGDEDGGMDFEGFGDD